jgi:uncharacterized membrane protein
MTKILEKLYPALGLSVVLAIAALIGLHGKSMGDPNMSITMHINIMLVLHVVSGILWIGLLWYFNFVQIPTMPKIPAELKPAIGKFIAPEALFWFRWSALATVITGLSVAWLRGYLVDALTFQNQVTIGVGMWLALVMAFNVWFIIWPNQKKALGIVPVADDAEKAKAARFAMLASRTNFVLSLPMLYCMVSQNIAG